MAAAPRRIARRIAAPPHRRTAAEPRSTLPLNVLTLRLSSSPCPSPCLCPSRPQAKYDEHGAAGILPECCKGADGHYCPPPHLIRCGDEMGIEPNGKRWSRVLSRMDADLVHRIVTGEHNPFWVTIFFWCRVDGVCDIPPCVIHKAAQMRGDLAHGLPQMPGKEWLVRASETGYLTADDWLLVCAHLKMHLPPARPQYIQIDGFVHHWDADALALLVEDEIFIEFLKSQNSDDDQLNDNGPNGERSHACSKCPPSVYSCSLPAHPISLA